MSAGNVYLKLKLANCLQLYHPCLVKRHTQIFTSSANEDMKQAQCRIHVP